MFVEIPIKNIWGSNNAVVNTDNIAYVEINRLEQVIISFTNSDVLATQLTYEELREVLINGKEKV